MESSNENPSLPSRLAGLSRHAQEYFDHAESALASVPRPGGFDFPEAEHFYGQLPSSVRLEADRLCRHLLEVAGIIAQETRNAPLVSDADQREIMLAAKSMRAAIYLRNFYARPQEVVHDEGRVYGVNPGSEGEHTGLHPESARRVYQEWQGKVQRILDLISAAGGSTQAVGVFPQESAKYRPGTAFVMMAMNRRQPELADLYDAVKSVFKQFDIDAVRADDIEHEDMITQRILDEIRTSEFLFADLTHERPNVYYEVGFAHALKRRVILFRKSGTGLHFDLAGYNCPEYENLVALREMRTRRLEHLTNRKPRSA